jgi:hypothetical protein
LGQQSVNGDLTLHKQALRAPTQHSDLAEAEHKRRKRMKDKDVFSRRKFLIGSATALGGALLAWAHHLLGTPLTQAQEPTVSPQAYLPLLFGTGGPTPEPSKPRVVQVRDHRATDWDGVGLFYDAVDQPTVTGMVQTGLQLLTGQVSWPDIWSVLFERVHPGGYSAGQKIAVKVNLNMNYDCETLGNIIGALPQPVLGMISGLVAAGVSPGDVIVYDSIRHPTSYFRDPIWAAYPGVKLLGTVPGTSPCPGVIAPTYGSDSSLTVRFSDPDGNISDRQLADVLYEATYVVNMPIIKAHNVEAGNAVTLSLKNHYGSIDYIVRDEDTYLHDYILNKNPLYRSTYSPLVDIWLNPNIRDKTILILGDGLYGSTGCCDPPIQAWDIFGGDACNSLFFATDPVASDCVMADLVVAEDDRVTREHTYDYIFCAQEAGLGVCEGTRDQPGGDPLRTPYGSGYQDIEYVRVDLGSVGI